MTCCALRIEKLSGPEAFEPLVDEWDALDAAQSPRTPFTSPLWSMLWWKHLRERRLFLRDEFHSYAVYDPSGALVAVAPMMLTYRPASGPLRARKLQFFGADPFITEVRGLISRPSDRSAATAAVVNHIQDDRQNWDWVEWFGANDQTSDTGLDSSTAPFRRTKEIPDYYVKLPATWEALRSELSPNTKEALRKCYNTLKRDGHHFALRIIERPEDLEKALATFFKLHTARAGVTTAVRHRDVFIRPQARAFLQEYAREMAARGQLRIFELTVDGSVVATRIAFELGREIYLYYSGYDPAWAKYNVMTTLMAEIIKWSIEQRFSILNLSTGTDRSKTRWRPETTSIWAGTLISSSTRGAIGHYVHENIMTEWFATVMPTWIVDRATR